MMPMVSAPLDVVPDGVGAGAGGDEVASFESTRPGTQHPPRAMHPPLPGSPLDDMTTERTYTVTTLQTLPLECT